MKKAHLLLLVGMATIGLAGCAGSQDSQRLTQKTVEYACGPGGSQPLTVQYTFRGDDAMSARVLHMNQAIDMTRVTSGNADMVGNTFRGGGYTWITGKFDRGDVHKVDGQMLTQDTAPGSMQGGYGAPAQGGMQGGGYGANMPGGMQGGAYGSGMQGGYGAPAQGGMHAPAPAGAAHGMVGTVLLRDCRVKS